jgi:hypothetical protein
MTAKRKGGRVYIAVTQRGEVVFHEGYVTLKEAARGSKTDALAQRPERPDSPDRCRPMSTCTVMPPCARP